MALRDTFSKLTFTSLIAGALFVIIGLQLLLFFGSFIFPSLVGIKVTAAIYLILAGAATYFLIKFLSRAEKLDRSQVLLLILVVLLVVGLVYGTKTYLPQFFSILPIK